MEKLTVKELLSLRGGADGGGESGCRKELEEEANTHEMPDTGDEETDKFFKKNMKRYIAAIITSIIALSSHANIIEIKEPAILEVNFIKETLKDTTRRGEKPPTSEVMALRIGNTSAMFYPPKCLWYDSLRTTNFDLSEKLYREANPPGSKTYVQLGGSEKEFVFRNIREGETMVYGRCGGESAYYIEPTELPEWSIGTETKEILGYDCIKATASYRGREWTAWFTPEIPISEGPWKLAGLPGLVLEAYDKHSDYRFVATQIKTDNLNPVGIYIYNSSDPIRFKSRTEMLERQFHENLSGNHTAKMQAMFGKAGSVRKPRRSKYDYLETDYPHEE